MARRAGSRQETAAIRGCRARQFGAACRSFAVVRGRCARLGIQSAAGRPEDQRVDRHRCPRQTRSPICRAIAPSRSARVLAQSIEAAAPVPYRMHRVADGMVETYEMLAFPMACRWGPPLAGVYVAEAGTRYNLVDTIFRSTNEGILALAAIRNAAGARDRFSDRRLQPGRRGDARRRREQHLQWCRLSELPLGIGLLGIRDRLIASIGTGRFDQFEFAFERGGAAKSTSMSASHRSAICCP